jgi:hypothetical protein
MSVITLNPNAEVDRANYTYSLGTTGGPQPTWGSGNFCGPLSNQVPNCSSGANNQFLVFNWSGNHTHFAATFSHNFDHVYFNVTGSNDSIYVNYSGNNFQVILVTLEGNYDAIYIHDSGNALGFYFWIYGAHDGVIADPTYSALSGNDEHYHINFVGWTSGSATCPSANVASTDYTNIWGGSGNFIYINTIWWNDVGVNTAVNNVTFGGNSEYITYQNESVSPGGTCAWNLGVSTARTQSNFGGLLDTLGDRYYPPVTVSFEEGAVIYGGPGNYSSMVSGPQMTVTNSPSGYLVNLTLVNFVPQNTTQSVSGYGMAYVSTSFVSDSTFTFTNAEFGSLQLLSPQYLTIATLYPGAWLAWAHGFRNIMPQGGSILGACVQEFGAQVCTVSIPIYDAGLTLNMVDVSMSMA